MAKLPHTRNIEGYNKTLLTIAQAHAATPAPSNAAIDTCPERKATIQHLTRHLAGLQHRRRQTPSAGKVALQREIWSTRRQLMQQKHQRHLDQLLLHGRVPPRRNRHQITELDGCPERSIWPDIITNHFRTQHEHHNDPYLDYLPNKRTPVDKPESSAPLKEEHNAPSKATPQSARSQTHAGGRAGTAEATAQPAQKEDGALKAGQRNEQPSSAVRHRPPDQFSPTPDRRKDTQSDSPHGKQTRERVGNTNRPGSNDADQATKGKGGHRPDSQFSPTQSPRQAHSEQRRHTTLPDLEAPAPHTEANLEPHPTFFTTDIVTRHIHRLQLRKATGPDRISNEMLRLLPQSTIEALAQHMQQIAEAKHPTPEAWRQLETILLPKKPATKLTSQLRPITLLDTTRKLYTAILAEHLKTHLQNKQVLSHHTFGYRAYHSTAHVHTHLHQLIRKSQIWGEPLTIATTDIRAAFDTLEHKHVHSALNHAQVPPSLTSALLTLITHNTTTYRLQDTASHPVSLRRGVLQGDAASALLFALTLDHILSQTEHDMTTNHLHYDADGTPFTFLIYADDLIITTDTVPHMQAAIHLIRTTLRRHHLDIAPAKTQFIHNQFTTMNNLQLDDSVLTPSDEITILGGLFSTSAQSTASYQFRTQKAWHAYLTHKNTLTSRHTPLKHRLQLLNATEGSTLLYSLNAHYLNAQQRQHLDKQLFHYVQLTANITPRPDESPGTYTRRRNRITRQITTTHRLSWKRTYWQNTLRLVQSTLLLPTASQPSASLQWRDAQWWKDRKHNFLKHAKPSPFRHPHRFNPIDYEAIPIQYHQWYTQHHKHETGPTHWHQFAYDDNAWQQNLTRYALTM